MTAAIRREMTVERASFADLAAFRRFVIDACGAARAGDAVRDALELAVDEVCTNVVEHGYTVMPEVSGFDVLAWLKADGALRHLPVIMISAAEDVDGIVRCLELGADDYLPKPCDPVVLRARVEAALERKRLRDRERLYADRFAGAPRARAVADIFAPDPRSMGPSGVSASTACLYHAVGATNDYIARTHARANMFATLFFGAIDPATGLLLYVNAGHEPPLIASGGRVSARLAPTGPALGLTPDAYFRVDSAFLAPGDVLVAFTDGATEARAPDGEMFGDERVAALCVPAAPSADAALARLEAAVRAHAAGADQSDDIAMLAVRREVV